MEELIPIGFVKNKFEKPTSPEEMKKHKSRIIIKDKFEKGLFKIEESNLLQMIFYLHLSQGYELKRERRYGGIRGVFASRSPHRPNPIGITTVKLLNKNKNELIITGLDAVNGTPVIDIKPYSKKMDEFPKNN